MAVKLNHTIVHARDKRESALFYAEVFGFSEPVPFGPFLDVATATVAARLSATYRPTSK